ncbi:MAG: hypothetical protein GDA51_07455 [Ekhidna sp.]|nr:hypothetical protein [Ekhidna sp.]
MKNTKIIIATLGILFSLHGTAQILQPAKWSSSASKSEVKVIETIELTFTAKLDDTWYIYSTDQDPDLGPNPTVFEFDKNNTFELVGDIMPMNVKEKYDNIWEGNVRILSKVAVFKQKVKILKPNPEIFVTVDYQVCTTVDGKCIPGDEEFEFNFEGE